MLSTASGRPWTAARATRFVRLEKNLSTLGYFTASSRRVRYLARKVILAPRIVDGQAIETMVEIVPSPQFGLPTTADQDQYFALLRIVTELHRRQGMIANPVTFSSAEILRLLGKRVNAGKNYEDLAQWLRRMSATTIRSKGTVYLAGKREWTNDPVRVFDRVVPFGAPLPDGQIAGRNYVWFSEWQLQNINHGNLIPMDWENYRGLRNPIARTMVPVLQVWLWSSREAGCVDKPYEEICSLLNLRMYGHGSKIMEKLGPSLRELSALGYLDRWELLRGSDRDYTLRFFHGDRFRHAALAPPD